MLNRCLLGVVTCLWLIAAWGCASNGNSASTGALAPKIDGIPCETTERLTYHIHAHLAILNQGQAVAVPAGIGIPGARCIYWLHTHDTTGVIHIEAPSKRDFTLGEFFDVWQQPLSTNHVLGMIADGQHTLRFFVDGQSFAGDPRGIALGAHTLITIQYGPPFPELPGFTFPPGY